MLLVNGLLIFGLVCIGLAAVFWLLYLYEVKK